MNSEEANQFLIDAAKEQRRTTELSLAEQKRANDLAEARLAFDKERDEKMRLLYEFRTDALKEIGYRLGEFVERSFHMVR